VVRPETYERESFQVRIFQSASAALRERAVDRSRLARGKGAASKSRALGPLLFALVRSSLTFGSTFSELGAMPPDIRRALELLAASIRQGRSADVLAYDVGPEVLAAVVRVGLASEHVEYLAVPGAQPIQITRVRLTEAGRQALTADYKQEGAVRITEAGRRAR
jgi:hypothetical protein